MKVRWQMMVILPTDLLIVQPKLAVVFFVPLGEGAEAITEGG